MGHGNVGSLVMTLHFIISLFLSKYMRYDTNEDDVPRYVR